LQYLSRPEFLLRVPPALIVQKISSYYEYLRQGREENLNLGGLTYGKQNEFS